MAYSTNAQVLNQQVETQRLVIPFSIIGNATAASVTFSNSLPGILGIATSGMSVSAMDASASGATIDNDLGQFALLVRPGDSVTEVLSCLLQRPAASGALQLEPVSWVDADGITPSGNIWLQVDSSIAVSAAATTKYVLMVEYKTSL